MTKPKVLLIGWDAADWKIMKPLMEQGDMPCVSQFVERGAMGNLATLKPVLSPMLWNSIATGKRPDKHGILGFTEFNPHTGRISPSLSTSRKVKALWNIASQEGLKSHVVNWFASHPAEKVNGVCVTETYSTPPKTANAPWVLSKDAIHPAEQYSALNELRLHPNELDGDILQMFCPLANKVEGESSRRLEKLVTQIVEAINVHTAATYILENEDWDFMGVYYGAIDHFCHLFMHFHPPQRPDVTDEDFEIYQEVINNCYRFHDVMLARLIELAGEDATIIVCSDHGFRSDHLRPPYTPLVPAGPAYWHRDQGVLMMAGPGVKKDELIHGATLLDIAPTTLALMGLPIARDMDGRVLTEALESTDRLSFIDSWENRPGSFPDGMHPENQRMSAEETEAILDQFVALGYIDEPDDDNDKAALTAQREAKWNLSTSFIDAGQVDRAIPLLIELVEDAHDRKDIILTLANCLQGVGLLDEAKSLSLVAMKHDVDEVAVEHTLAEIALSERRPDDALQHLEKVAELTDDPTAEFSEFYRVGRSLTLGGTYLKLRLWQQALDCFNEVLRLDPDHVRAWHGAGQALLRMRRNDEALDCALYAVELEYRSFLGHHLLATAFARKKQWERATEACLVALRFRPAQIATLRILATCYAKQGLWDEQQQCKTTINQLRAQHQEQNDATSQQVEDTKARLGRLINELNDYFDQKKLAQDEEEKRKSEEGKDQSKSPATPKTSSPSVVQPSGKELLLVSGLPRSGTSLMMQMLVAGGISPMTDEHRKPDEDNPRGYFEWEQIKKLKSQPEIIDQAEGKVTKVISMLLPHLPQNHDYKIIFLMRPIEQIVASQRKMIERLQTQGAKLDESSLVRNLTQHRNTVLELLQTMPVKLYLIKYEHLINRTKNAAQSIQEFVGSAYQLDIDEMCQQVQPDLWRNRGEPIADEAASE